MEPNPGLVQPEDFGVGRLFRAIRDAVIVADVSTGRVVLWNPAAEKIFGYTQSEAVGLLIEDLVPERLKEAHREGMRRYREQGHGRFVDANTLLELPAVRKDGTELTVELTLSPITDTPLEGRYVLALVRDVSERKRAELALRQSEERYRQLIDTANEGIWIIDVNDVTTYANPKLAAMLGYPVAEMLGKSVEQFLLPEDIPEQRRRLDELKAGIMGQSDTRLRREDGTALWAVISAAPLFDADGRYAGWVGMLTDITERKMLEAELEELSSTDSLTGIANRRTFDLTLEAEWRRATRMQAPLALIIADIDYFKRYNDTLGHPAGDHCLRQVAHSLAQTVRRAGDLVARYGGEEFVVLLPNTETSSAMAMAEILRSRIERLRILHPASPVADHVTLSLGVASIVPAVGASPTDLIRQADQALYAAKDSGRNRSRVALGPEP